MIRVGFVRGAYLNNFESQNFIFDRSTIQLRGFCSLHPIHTEYPFPITQLSSICDLNFVPFLHKMPFYGQAIKYISNRLLGDSQILFGLENQIADYDIVDTADPHYYYSYQLARMRKANKIKKLIVTYCEVIPFNNESVQKKKYIKYFTLNQADIFICHTELSKKALILEGMPSDKIHVVKLGVDLNRFKRVDKGISDRVTILFVGRLVQEKGILDLYQAFKAISHSGLSNVCLKIIGDGPLKKTLQLMVEKDKLQDEVMISEIPYEKMHIAYQESDIFVLPSRSTKTIAEQYGMVLVEAMACGLPIIATNVGAMPEVVGEAGIIVEESDVKSLESALIKLIKNPEFRKSQAQLSFIRAQAEFDSSKTAKSIGRIYTDLLGC